MTEIAARAAASIGSLYQFFPTKTLIAEALHQRQLQALSSKIDALAAAIPASSSMADVAGSLFDTLFEFLAENPAFPVMADRNDVDKDRKAHTRSAMLQQIGNLFAVAAPPPSSARRETMAVLLLTLMKAAVSLRAGQSDEPQAGRLVAELRTMAVAHFDAHGRN